MDDDLVTVVPNTPPTADPHEERIAALGDVAGTVVNSTVRDVLRGSVTFLSIVPSRLLLNTPKVGVSLGRVAFRTSKDF